MVLGPIMLAFIWVGGLPFAALVAVLAALGGVEGAGLLRRGGVAAPAWLAAGGSVLAVAGAAWAGPRGLLVAVVLGAAAALLWPVVRGGPGRAMEGLATLLPLAMAGWFPAHLVLLRDLDAGRGWTFLAVLAVWGFDTAGYFVGRAVGGPRLSPTISPNKTWSGLVGGLAASAGLAALVSGWFLGTGWAQGALLGVVIGGWAQAGDLAESAWKRWAGVKDAGRLIPGHGGVLDRFDALFFVAPLAYWAAAVLG